MCRGCLGVGLSQVTKLGCGGGGGGGDHLLIACFHQKRKEMFTTCAKG